MGVASQQPQHLASPQTGMQHMRLPSDAPTSTPYDGSYYGQSYSQSYSWDQQQSAPSQQYGYDTMYAYDQGGASQQVTTNPYQQQQAKLSMYDSAPAPSAHYQAGSVYYQS